MGMCLLRDGLQDKEAQQKDVDAVCDDQIKVAKEHNILIDKRRKVWRLCLGDEELMSFPYSAKRGCSVESALQSAIRESALLKTFTDRVAFWKTKDCTQYFTEHSLPMMRNKTVQTRQAQAAQHMWKNRADTKTASAPEGLKSTTHGGPETALGGGPETASGGGSGKPDAKEKRLLDLPTGPTSSSSKGKKDRR